MDIEFLGQGLFPDSEKSIGSLLIDSLSSGEFERLTCIVAFASQGGVDILSEYIDKATSALKEINIYIGIDLHGTSKEALDAFIKLGINTSIFYTTSALVFHPKIYIFEGSDKYQIIIGSSNMTIPGMFYNAEASVLLQFTNTDDTGMKFLEEIQNYYRDIFSGDDRNLAILDDDLIKKLVDLKLVWSESERRKTQEKGGHSPEDSDTSETPKQLADIFPPRKLGRVPSHPHSKIKGEKLAKEPKKTTIPSIMSEIFWIQTGALTGGSGNQLDLSMSGPHGSTGSVSLFGIDPAKIDTSKSISLQYEGIAYKGNTLKFPLNSTGLTNGTWRMQLHGVAENGNKLTPICRGNFRHKIIVFKKIDTDSYEIHLEDESKLDEMKDKSLYWDQNSNTRGKHFGKIQ